MTKSFLFVPSVFTDVNPCRRRWWNNGDFYQRPVRWVVCLCNPVYAFQLTRELFQNCNYYIFDHIAYWYNVTFLSFLISNPGYQSIQLYWRLLFFLTCGTTIGLCPSQVSRNSSAMSLWLCLISSVCVKYLWIAIFRMRLCFHVNRSLWSVYCVVTKCSVIDKNY